jgi:DNA-binding transcriptional LysR family regulator
MDATLRGARALRTGYLTIGLSCHHDVMGILAAYMQRYPGIQVNVRIGNSLDLLEAVVACSIDIAGVTAARPDARLFSHRFSCQRIVLFVARTHAWGNRSSVSAAQLHDERMVTWQATSMTRTLFSGRLAVQGIRPRVVLELDSWEAIREAVAAGLGFGIALADAFTLDSRLRIIALTGVELTAQQYLVCLPEFRTFGPVQAFFELAEAFGKDPADARGSVPRTPKRSRPA